MKTHDEIKKGLTCVCDSPECEDCAYATKVEDKEFGEILQFHCSEIYKDAYELIIQLESRLAQVEREREAAEHDLHLLADGEGACNVCARFDEGYIPTPPHCRYAWDDDCFRWRGVCAENTKEDSE